MKEKIRAIIADAAGRAFQNGRLPSAVLPGYEVEEPKIKAHGDYATNFAMTAAAVYRMPPRAIAEVIISHLDHSGQFISRTEIAGPGFINFFVNPASWLPTLETIHTDPAYGACDLGRGRSIMVEFVSANPTGPLHVGHGRGAAVGDSLANILSFCGWKVQREYYVNDAGNQIMTLGRSVYLRWRETCGEKIPFPEDCYQGDYIVDLAREMAEKNLLDSTGMDEPTVVKNCAEYAAGRIMDGIRRDLADFRIHFDNWFSEKSLFAGNAVADTLESLRAGQFAYEADGALWFKSTAFGDEKDRVVIRNNGEATYFASDIAYHKNKFDRGFDRLVDIWGADHHGYIPRVKGAVQALGRSGDDIDVILVQLVNLLRNNAPVSMSTRSGTFVTLREVFDEVGVDAARFIFLSRHYDSPLDFDLELAKKKSNDNPVYYVQYVHARIASMLRKADEMGIGRISADTPVVSRLDQAEEIDLIKAAARYPDAVRTAARFMEPHRVTFYLMDLAACFHAYYNRHKVLGDDPELSAARLYLVCAVKKIIQNGLALLGVFAPESM
ncbi:MAG: arginine--tRNA ligase [Thermodesulfobacteriota bacterium]